MFEYEVEAVVTVGQDDLFTPVKNVECSGISSIRSFDSAHPDAMTIDNILEKSGGFGRF